MCKERKRVPIAWRSVRDRSRASSATLTVSFNPNCHALVIELSVELTVASLRFGSIDDPLNHVDRFVLCFVIDPCHHFAEQAHTYQLHPQNHQENCEQQQRPPANLLSHDQFK